MLTNGARITNQLLKKRKPHDLAASKFRYHLKNSSRHACQRSCPTQNDRRPAKSVYQKTKKEKKTIQVFLLKLPNTKTLPQLSTPHMAISSSNQPIGSPPYSLTAWKAPY